MINIKEYTENLQLKLGDSKRMNCPSCNGYNTFTVTNNDVVKTLGKDTFDPGALKMAKKTNKNKAMTVDG